MHGSTILNHSAHFIIWLFLLAFGAVPVSPAKEIPSGIEKLHHLSTHEAFTLVPLEARALLTPTDQELFLKELEGEVPDWSRLKDQPNEEMGERLFAFNRERDNDRENHVLLKQPITFLWSGLLRQYVREHEGFSIAIGPEFTETAWGIVRFKPVGLPQELIAIPSPALRADIQRQLAQGDHVEIKILFTGRLNPDESIIYAFSHDDPDLGMIIPVVQVEDVRYFFETSDKE